MKHAQKSRTSQAIPANAGIAFLFLVVLGSLSGCSVIARRPIQEMSDAAAALKAAREVQADTNSTDYFRLSEELFFKARQEYRYKNFARAKKYATEARELAEKAEFLSIRGGAVRSSLSVPPVDAGNPPAVDSAPANPPTAPADPPPPNS